MFSVTRLLAIDGAADFIGNSQIRSIAERITPINLEAACQAYCRFRDENHERIITLAVEAACNQSEDEFWGVVSVIVSHNTSTDSILPKKLLDALLASEADLDLERLTRLFNINMTTLEFDGLIADNKN